MRVTRMQRRFRSSFATEYKPKASPKIGLAGSLVPEIIPCQKRRLLDEVYTITCYLNECGKDVPSQLR